MDSGRSKLASNLKKLELCYQLILVGYDPISCNEVAQATGDPQLQEAAQQSL